MDRIDWHEAKQTAAPDFSTNDGVGDWARLESKSQSTEDDLRRRYEPLVASRPTTKLLLAAGAAAAAWLCQSCLDQPAGTTPPAQEDVIPAQFAGGPVRY